MKVTFLGTGTSQGIPLIACDCEVCVSADTRDVRLRSSVHVFVDDLSIVIDTGPDFRTQMLNSGIVDLDAVLLTHQRKDHTAGLDDIRPFNFKYDKTIPLYASQAVQAQIRREFSYIFAPHEHAGLPRVKQHIVNDAPFYINQTKIIPIQTHAQNYANAHPSYPPNTKHTCLLYTF